MIGRSTSVVRSSGASGATRTRGRAASGSQRAIGSSRPSAPSCTRLSASAAPMGLVMDAIRKSVSSRMGGLCAPSAVRPPALTSTRPPMRTAATYPGIRPAASRASAAAHTRSKLVSVMVLQVVAASASLLMTGARAATHRSASRRSTSRRHSSRCRRQRAKPSIERAARKTTVGSRTARNRAPSIGSPPRAGR